MAGDITGGSSSSSWVGCREQSIVSSVMQLEMRMQKAVEHIRPKNTVILLSMSHILYVGSSYFTHTVCRYRKKCNPPRKAAAPRHFGGLVFQLGVGVV